MISFWRSQLREKKPFFKILILILSAEEGEGVESHLRLDQNRFTFKTNMTSEGSEMRIALDQMRFPSITCVIITFDGPKLRS